MSVFDETVAEFGRQLGIDGLAADASGVVTLEVERIGALQLERREGAVLVTLVRAWPPHAENAASEALRLCHWREGHRWPLNAGAKGAELLTLTATVAENEFTVREMDALLAYLSNLLDRMA